MLVPMPDDYPVPLLLRLRRAVPGKLRRRISSICVRVFPWIRDGGHHRGVRRVACADHVPPIGDADPGLGRDRQIAVF